MKSFLIEARRRKVFRSAGLYIVAVWVVLQVADLAFESWGIPAKALRYVWIGALVGFPLVIVLAWKFQVTEHGVVRFGDEPFEGNTLALDWRDWLVLLGIAFIAIATMVGISREAEQSETFADTYKAAPEIGADGRIDSIAVLPFENYSSDSSRRFLADGIAEAILHILAQNRELLVTARTSSFYFRDKDVTAAEIGRILGVQALLEGSVQIEDDRLKVTSQLIRTSDQSHIWSDVYEGPLDDVFSVQDQIARTVRDQVLAEKDPKEPASSNVNYPSVEAYELLLEAKSELDDNSLDSTEEAIRLLQLATEISPEYSDVHSWLSHALGQKRSLLRLTQSKDYSDTRDLSRQAVAATARAIELDPENAQAILQQGMYSQSEGGQGYADAKRRAAEVAPNDPEILKWLAVLATQALNLQEVNTYIDRARAVDPSNFEIFLRHIDRSCAVEPVVAKIEAQLATYPVKLSDAISARGIGYWCDGRYADYIRTGLTLVKLRTEPDIALGVLTKLATLGLEEALLQINEAHMLVPGLANTTYDNTVFFSSIANERLLVYQFHQGRRFDEPYFRPISQATLEIQLGYIENAKINLDRVQRLWEEYHSYNDGRVMQMQTLTIYAYQAWLMSQQGEHEESTALAEELLEFLQERKLTKWLETKGLLREVPLLILLLNGQTDEAIEWLRDSEQYRWDEFQVVLASPIYAEFRDIPEVEEILARMVAWRDDVVAEFKNTALPEVLDPSLLVAAIEARVAPSELRLAEVEMHFRDNLEASAKHMAKVLEQDRRDFWVIDTASQLAARLNRIDELIALRIIQASEFEINPYVHFQLGKAYFYSRQWNKAIESYGRALELAPDWFGIQLQIGLAQVFAGAHEDALVAMQNSSRDINRNFGLAIAYHAMGETAKSDAALSDFMAVEFPGFAFNAAAIHAFRSENDKAFEWLDKLLQDESRSKSAPVRVNPLFDNLHGDARWLPLLREFGQAPEQVDHIEFHVPMAE